MDKKRLLKFLLKARTKTYAGDSGNVESALKDTKQLEYQEGDWLYRDVYYTGKGIFMGLETVYYKDKAVWSMSYYGNFQKMSETEVDSILRKALLENWQTVRTWQKVEWEHNEYRYICEPDSDGSIDEMSGSEKIFKNGEKIYYFYYAGGVIT